MSTSSLSEGRQSSGEIAILEAAIRLFSTHGFDGVSMRQIAETAGVSKANIYHHFQSKEALYLAIISDSARKLSMLVESLAEGGGEMSDAIETFALAHLDHLFENQTTVRLVLREGWSGSDEGAKRLTAEVMTGVFDRMQAIFRSGQACGVLREDLDPGLCAMMLLGSDLMFFQFQDVLKHMPGADFSRDRSRYTRGMTDVLLNGMRVSS
jgi:TetR/AcrR family transcriptional regulator